MKKIILIVMALALIPAIAHSTVIVRKSMNSSGAAGSSCDDCTSPLTFAWHAEDTNVATGTPCGCSIGDADATLISAAVISGSQKTDGTNSISFPTGDDLAAFDVTNEDLLNKDSGTITLDFYITTFVDFATFFQYYIDSNNYIRIYPNGGDELTFRYRGQSTNVNVTTTAANLTTNTWYSLTMKWRTGASNPSLSVTANSDTVTTDTDLTAISGNSGTLQFGTSFGTGTYGFIDNIKIYDTWQ